MRRLADVQPVDEIYVQKEGKAGVDQYGLKVYWRYRSSSYRESRHGDFNRTWQGGNYGPEMAQVRAAGGGLQMWQVMPVTLGSVGGV